MHPSKAFTKGTESASASARRVDAALICIALIRKGVGWTNAKAIVQWAYPELVSSIPAPPVDYNIIGYCTKCDATLTETTEVRHGCKNCNTNTGNSHDVYHYTKLLVTYNSYASTDLHYYFTRALKRIHDHETSIKLKETSRGETS